MKEAQITVKKIITAAICVFLMIFSPMPAVSAQEENRYILDEVGSFGDAVAFLNQEAEAISNRLGVNITFLLEKNTDGQIEEYANIVYEELFGNADGLMLIISREESKWFMGEFGAVAEVITEEDEDVMWDAFCVREYYDECITDYIKKAEEILVGKGFGAAASSPETAKNIIPQERQLPRLVDEADLLTETEETNLLQMLDEISERQKCDVAVVTVNGLAGKTATEFADDFYDYNGYGYGENDDGILLLISMEERDWAITTYGFGIPAFTDAGQEYMVGKFRPYLSNGDYEKAFMTFAQLCDDFMTQAYTGEPYDNGNLPKGTVHWIWIPIDFIVGCGIALFIALRKKSKLKTVVQNDTANAYTVPGSLIISRKSDMLYDKKVTSYTVSESKSSGRSSGSSTHVSSSGRSHGGSSGKF